MRVTTNEHVWTHWGLNPGPSACGADVIPLHHVPSLAPFARSALVAVALSPGRRAWRSGRVWCAAAGGRAVRAVLTPAIAQLAEHLTVDACSNQMVPGSIPGGRIHCGTRFAGCTASRAPGTLLLHFLCAPCAGPAVARPLVCVSRCPSLGFAPALALAWKHPRRDSNPQSSD